MSGGQSEDLCYKIKNIKVPPALGDRKSHILLQDINGPCPLIAILNVLLLRGSILLPEGAGEITQAKAMQLLAEHLLDTNFARSKSAAASELYQANLQHNLSDAIAQLPKLTTGIDVNVRFDGPQSIEYTGETAVFDLLGIDLVHGWLIDPEDSTTAAALGSKSYNEVVMAIVNRLGGDATPQSAMSRRNTLQSGVTAPLVRPATQSPSHQKQQQHSLDENQVAKNIDAEMLSEALKTALKMEDGTPSTPESMTIPINRDASSHVSARYSQDSVASAINKMMDQTVKDAFKTPLALSFDREASSSSAAAAAAVKESQSSGEVSLNREDQDMREKGGPQGRPGSSSSGTTESEAPRAPPPSAASTFRQEGVLGTAANAPSVLPLAPHEIIQESAATPSSEKVIAEDEREALIMREFLENNPSQLTIYGLSSLIGALPEGSLAVFFRNNHFNVVLKSGGGLYILVTDQGYLFEPDVVWEQLTNVDGDTELVGWDLKAFSPHVEAGNDGHEDLAVLQENRPASAGYVIGTEDADFALALQLQQEEEDRIRRAEERQRASAAAIQQQQQRPGDVGVSSNKKPEKPKKSTDCTIM